LQSMRKVENFAAYARDNGATPVQLALAWILARPDVCSAIVGATTIDQLREASTASGMSPGGGVLGEVEEMFR